jgi:enoyl-CoA hydratase
MDGVTMGGGVGISRPARYRVATERTLFAMPETGIGLFPDVGGGWYLSRIPDHIGMWAALTGARLKAADCLLIDIATHHTPSADIDALKARLLAEPERFETILGAAHVDPGPAPLAEARGKIAALFAGDSVESIFAALEADSGEWASDQLAILRKKSPQAMKVSFRQLQLGAAMNSFANNMVMEYRLAGRVVRTNDFREGVRAVIVDKDNAPRWSPPDLAGVTPALLDSLFAPLPADQEWSPLP